MERPVEGALRRSSSVANFKRQIAWLIVAGIAMVAVSIGYLLTAGVFVSIVLGGGLMAAGFFSADSGIDDDVANATPKLSAVTEPEANE